MSAVHPPGNPVPLRKPCAANVPFGFGQVVSVGAMIESIRNGALVNALPNDEPVVESVHVVGSGLGDVRLTSFWRRQVNGTPFWFFWIVCAGSALPIPFTPSQS